MKEDSVSRGFLLLALLLAILAISLHFFQLGETPPGFFVDEASVAYNAFCLDTVGIDEHGKSFPLFFKCFGQYQDPVPIYAVALCGLFTEITRPLARAPIAAFHILASVAFFFLARRYVRNPHLALAGAFAFSCVPWLFPISRMAMMGHLPMLLGICAGWFLLMKAFTGKSSVPYAIASAFFWAFAAYSHNSGRPFIAIFLFAFVALFNKALIKRWRAMLAFCATLGILCLPTALVMLTNPAALTQRFNDVCVWNDASGILDAVRRVALNYIGYFNPAFLFLKGDPIPQHHTGVGGEMYICMAPLALCGLCFLAGRLKGRPWNTLVFVSLLAYPVAATVTSTPWHSTRAAIGSLAWCLLATIGLKFICVKLKRKPGVLHPLLAVMAAAFAVEASNYFSDYFTNYKSRCAVEFISPLVESMEYAYGNCPAGRRLHVSAIPSACGAIMGIKPSFYIYGLFFSKSDPREYLKEGRVSGGKVCQYGERDTLEGDIVIRQALFLSNTPDGLVLIRENPAPPPSGGVLLKSFTGTDFSEPFLRGHAKIFRDGRLLSAQEAVPTEAEMTESYEIYRIQAAPSSRP